MSATSSLWRRTAAGYTPALGLPSGQRLESVERAGYGADRGVGDTGVTGGGIELGVAEQHLDDADVGILFQEMGGKAVPQRMWRHPLFDPGGLGGAVNGTVKLTGRQWLDRIAPR